VLPCTPIGSPCSSHSECCEPPGLSQESFCEEYSGVCTACRNVGEDCVADVDCCGLFNYCRSSGRCGSCSEQNQVCETDGDCCRNRGKSATCDSHICIECTLEGQACDDNTNCCDNPSYDVACQNSLCLRKLTNPGGGYSLTPPIFTGIGCDDDGDGFVSAGECQGPCGGFLDFFRQACFVSFSI
jgi:hypothetical protein